MLRLSKNFKLRKSSIKGDEKIEFFIDSISSHDLKLSALVFNTLLSWMKTMKEDVLKKREGLFEKLISKLQLECSIYSNTEFQNYLNQIKKVLRHRLNRDYMKNETKAAFEKLSVARKVAGSTGTLQQFETPKRVEKRSKLAAQTPINAKEIVKPEVVTCILSDDDFQAIYNDFISAQEITTE